MKVSRISLAWMGSISSTGCESIRAEPWRASRPTRSWSELAGLLASSPLRFSSASRSAPSRWISTSAVLRRPLHRRSSGAPESVIASPQWSHRHVGRRRRDDRSECWFARVPPGRALRRAHLDLDLDAVPELGRHDRLRIAQPVSIHRVEAVGRASGGGALAITRRRFARDRFRWRPDNSVAANSPMTWSRGMGWSPAPCRSDAADLAVAERLDFAVFGAEDVREDRACLLEGPRSRSTPSPLPRAPAPRRAQESARDKDARGDTPADDGGRGTYARRGLPPGSRLACGSRALRTRL